MATTKFVNRARMTTDTTGTGSSINLVVAVPKYFTFSEAGLQDGDVVDYIIEDGDDFEIQHDQTYSSSGPSLSRGTPAASKVGGSAGTSQISLSGGAQVAIVAVAKSLDVSTFTEKSSPELTDFLWGLDAATGERAKFPLSGLFTQSPAAIQVFTSSGTYTPTEGMKACLVIATGGGGGGGGADGLDTGMKAAGGGGGAGGTVIALLDASDIGASQPVTIGSGGSGGANTGGNGGNGGNTTLGNLLTAGGGTGGQGEATANNPGTGVSGGSGGTATGGDLNIGGTNGGPSWHVQEFRSMSGFGGASFWGGGAPAVSGTGNSTYGFDGISASAYGAGGGGAVLSNSTAGRPGGNGGSGVMVILEFF